MRVLFVNHTCTVSGAERALLQLLDGLRREHQIIAACPKTGALAGEIDRRSVRRRAIPSFEASFRPDLLQTPAGLIRLGAASVAVAGMVRRYRPDVVYANTTRAALTAILSRRLEPVPLVLRLHDHLPQTSAGSAVRGLIAAHADAVLAVSQYTATRFNAGLARPLATCVYNGIDHARFDPHRVTAAPLRREFRLEANVLLLGHVAQITPWKGQAESIRVCSELRRRGVDAHLFLVGGVAFTGRQVRFGNPAYLAQLHALVDSLGLEDCVHFLGVRDDVPSLLRSFDLVLLPSQEEPGALVVAESLAMGTPAFVSDEGGTAEFLEDGVSGRALPVGRPELWAQAIVETVSEGDALERMSRKAVAAAARFTAEAHVHEVEAHLERVLGATLPVPSVAAVMS